MIYWIVLFFHFIVCVLLAGVILMQSSKGTGLASSVGGGMQSVFGSQGSASFLTKATSVLAILFMINCLVLALLTKTIDTSKVSGGIIKEAAQEGVFKPILDTNTDNHKLLTPDEMNTKKVNTKENEKTVNSSTKTEENTKSE